MIEVITGFGYYTDSSEHIVAKAILPPGYHEIDAGLTYTEVADLEALNAIEVYAEAVAPASDFSIDLAACETLSDLKSFIASRLLWAAR